MRVYRQVVATPSALRALLLLTALATAGSILFGQTAPSPAETPCGTELTQESARCAVTLAPSQTRDLLVVVPQGQVRMLTVEQVDGTVELRLPVESTSGSASQAPEPYTNKAGLHSKIRILLLSEPQSGQTTRIGNSSKKAATVLITADLTTPVNDLLERERGAEDAFAHAEFLRSQGAEDKAAEALAAYDRSIADWKELGNKQELARALIWKADFLINNQGNAALASPVIGEAADLAPFLEPIEAAHYWQVVAFVNVAQGKYEVVRSAYSKALALCEEDGDVGYEAKILDNLARMELMEGQTEAAMSDEQRAAAFAAEVGDTRREAFVQEELGAIYSTVGDFESAYRAYGQALTQLSLLPPNPQMQAAIWTDLSDFYLTLGDLERAKDALDQAMETWKTTDYPVGAVDTLNNYGDLYLEKGQPQTARAYFVRGLAISEKILYERGSIALMAGIGDSYLYQGDAARAEDILGRALVRAEKADQADSKIEMYCELGDAATLKPDFKQAQQYYEMCRKESATAQDPYHEVRAEGGLARIAFQFGALYDAQSHCEHALSEIEEIRGHLRNQDLKTSFFASQHAYYDLDIQILARLGEAHPHEDYTWQAFLVAERSRARTLLDEITTTNTEIRGVASQALLAQYEDIQRRRRRLEASAVQPHAPHAGAGSDTKRATIERLTLSEYRLHQEILATGTSDSSLASSPRLTLEALEDALPNDHSALVEYWTGEKASYGWSITRSGIRGFRMPPASQLDRQCAAFRKALLATASRNPHLSAERRADLQPKLESRWRNLGAQLAETLFPCGMLSPSTSTVLIVGDGSIESVPFAALSILLPVHTPKTSPRNVTFLNEPSATILSFLEAQHSSPHTMRLAIFTAEQQSTKMQGAWIRHASQNEQRKQAVESSTLPFTGDESAMLRALFGASATRTFSGSSVSPKTLQDLDWSQFSIGHFAMHAALNERYAELNGLSPIGEQGPASAKLLWYGDVCHLHAKLDLVVLSACNTALGEQLQGEGLRGLTQAFFAAGSQRVLGTLWEVDDQATSEWMRHFYESLKQTRSPVTALQNAQARMAGDPQWSSPYYWAGFVLAGDWRPLP